ncbi:Beta-galactosidase C-terminal domain [Streptomyces sp. NPDC001393]
MLVEVGPRQAAPNDRPGSHHDLLGGGRGTGSLTLGRYGVAVLRP